MLPAGFQAKVASPIQPQGVIDSPVDAGNKEASLGLIAGWGTKILQAEPRPTSPKKDF